MPTKDIIQISIAGIAVVGNIVAVVWAFSWMKFQVLSLKKQMAEIRAVLYPHDGRLQFQTLSECAGFRKSCREEVCAFIKAELSDQKTAIRRIHERLDNIGGGRK
jgi:hypothetical protein